MFTRKVFFGFLFITMNLIPASAFGAEGKVEEKIKPDTVTAPKDEDFKKTPSGSFITDDLSYSEAKATFPGFEIKPTKLHPAKEFATEISLIGSVFKDCFNKFKFNFDSEKLSIQIRDVGVSKGGISGRVCQDDMKKAGRTCADTACVRLSSIPAMDLTSAPTGKIKLARQDKMNDDEGNIRYEEIPGLEHISKEDAELQARIKKIEKYKDCVANCANSAARINSAQQLIKMGEFDKSLEEFKKEAYLGDLKAIQSKISKAKGDELESIREEVLSWAEKHSDMADKVVPVYKEIAVKYIPKSGSKPSDYENAIETLHEAQGVSGISDGASAQLDAMVMNSTVARMQSIAMMGTQGNMLFWPNLWQLNQQLQQNVMSNCYGSNSGVMMPFGGFQQSVQSSSFNNEACSQAMQAARTMPQIMQAAQQVDYQRQQSQMQFQQMMSQSGMGGMGMNNNMFGLPGMNSMYFNGGNQYGNNMPQQQYMPNNQYPMQQGNGYQMPVNNGMNNGFFR